MDRRIARFERLDSTMTIAATLAAEGCASGTVVVADEQTAGIGRHGHTWVSEKGTGLYASIVLRLPVEARVLPVAMLALGLAAREAIAEVSTLAPDLRWPNDVLIRERKCAGILAQLSTDFACSASRRAGSPALQEDAIIAGIGINVSQTSFPTGLDTPATSLLLEGAQVGREELLGMLVEAVDRFCRVLTDEGTDAILRMFEASSSYARGRRVRVEQGEAIIEGVTEGLDASGFLIVRQDDGQLMTIQTGGVRANL
jgi:BirA family biotin operon repressor/biotin-[acetyl-CoA-carboxylase] ligase